MKHDELPAAPHDADADEGRRGLFAALLGLGVAGLAGCAVEASDEEKTSRAVAAATGVAGSVVVTWADTILGVPPTNPPTTRTGDLATKTAMAIDASGKTVVVVAKGCITAGDGGGGVFYWTSEPVLLDDGGTLIVPLGNIGSSAANGCWRRIYSGPMSVLWFGALGDNATSTDDSRAINLAIKAAPDGGTVLFPRPKAKYKIASSIGGLLGSKSIRLMAQDPGVEITTTSTTLSLIDVAVTSADPPRTIQIDGLAFSNGGIAISLSSSNSGTLTRNSWLRAIRCSGQNYYGIKIDGPLMTGCHHQDIEVELAPGSQAGGLFLRGSLGAFTSTVWTAVRVVGAGAPEAIRIENTDATNEMAGIVFINPIVESNYRAGFCVIGSRVTLYNAHMENNGRNLPASADIVMTAVLSPGVIPTDVTLFGGYFSTPGLKQAVGSRNKRIEFTTIHNRLALIRPRVNETGTDMVETNGKWAGCTIFMSEMVSTMFVNSFFVDDLGTQVRGHLQCVRQSASTNHDGTHNLPASSTVNIGEIAFNAQPAADGTGYVGWVNTASGWRKFGAIASTE
jgi:hypothetical protein